MRFHVIHEAVFELTVDAPSEKEAERVAASVPYPEWENPYTVREECVPNG